MIKANQILAGAFYLLAIGLFLSGSIPAILASLPPKVQGTYWDFPVWVIVYSYVPSLLCFGIAHKLLPYKWMLRGYLSAIGIVPLLIGILIFAQSN